MDNNQKYEVSYMFNSKYMLKSIYGEKAAGKCRKLKNFGYRLLTGNGKIPPSKHFKFP